MQKTLGQQLYDENKNKYDMVEWGPTIVLDNLRDPCNFGSILRLAECFKAPEVVILGVDKLCRKTRNIARGCEEYTKLTFADDVAKCSLHPLVAVELTNESVDLFDFKFDTDSPIGLVVGNESQGITNQVLQLCTRAIKVPMFGRRGSMNVSHALAISLYEWRRQKRAEKTATSLI